MTKKSSCEVFAQYFSSGFKAEDFYSTVIDGFLCHTAIMLNIVTIHAIRKTSSLPETLKTLLLSLAVSDVGVGLLIQPFYISLLVKELQQNTSDCSTDKAFETMVVVFSTASFWGVVTISVGRFLALIFISDTRNL